MSDHQHHDNRSIGWIGLKRGHKARPLEWFAEKAIFVVSTSAILMIFLIFLFIGRAAVPILFGSANSSLVQKVIPPEQLDNLKPEELQEYLGLTPKEFAAKDKETLRLLMEVRVDMAKEAPDDKDAAIDTTEWRYLLRPHQWTGYDKPEYIWQPVSSIHKYNIIPLIIGSIKTTIVALLFSVPLSLGAALFVSQLAPAKIRELVKPCIELLAGIPSVVLGFFALIVLATVLQKVFGFESRLNATVAGIA